MFACRLLLLAGLLVSAISQDMRAQSSSFYPTRLKDKSAVYLSKEDFGASGDGTTDDTVAMQKAIDRVTETTHQGIVFIPEGRYRLTHTLYVHPGVRVIGYGARRPVLVLGANTPGYQKGPSYMVLFTGGRTGERHRGGRSASALSVNLPAFPGTVPATSDVVDANPGTFYSAMSNVDFEIGDGNPGAVGIRFHVAQHCFLTHMDFHIGSGMAALQEIGNEAEDLHFYGGQYAILTGRPSPGWQFTLLDSVFDGQREAAIKEHEAGLALVNDTFRNVPTAIEIEPKHIEELWIRNSRFENISGPAILISEEDSRLTEINVEDALCDRVTVFAKLRESGKEFSGKGTKYRVNTFTHGLIFDSPQAKGSIESRIDAESIGVLPAVVPSIRALPSQKGWANAIELGAKGDGKTDDTAALQHAVDTERIVYLPSGRYLLTDTLLLRSDTVLIGLHPSTTQLLLADSTSGFDGVGIPKAMLSSPPGGSTVVMGIGLYTGGVNSLAVGAMWMAGKDSLMDDVRFLGGHGTNAADGTRMNPYNNTHSGDPNPLYRWDAQYPSLWVLDGGGGTFADIWTPDTFSQAGMYISDTKTEGHVYELSSEHHVHNEVKLNHVANWEIVALQTEEERGEGPQCLPLDIKDSENITIAEMHAYRVVSSLVPFPEAIHVSNSRNIRFRNLHIYSDSKVVFDASVRDDNSGVTNRELEIAALTIPDRTTMAADVEKHVEAVRLIGGFFNPSSATVDSRGRLYFVDASKQHIYRYLPAEKRLELISDSPIDPANIFFDRSDNLMIVSYAGNGTVYTIAPNAHIGNMQILKPQTAAPRPGLISVLPVDHWRFDAERERDIGESKPWQYVSPDGSTFLPAGDDFVEGALYYGTKMADVLRAFSLANTAPGKTFYVSDEGQKKTYSGQVKSDGSLTSVRLFANQGGESIAISPDGNVYIADGQIYVYRPDGTRLGEIDVAERPTSIVFGGKDGRTLFILARTSLYSADAIVPN